MTRHSAEHRTRHGNRLVVGVDGSPAAQHALDWAVREAVRRHAAVLVVTAEPDGAHTGHSPAEQAEAISRHLRISGMQREAMAAAVATLPPGQRPVLAREIILADPVSALVHAGRYADLLVLGADARHGLIRSSVAGRIAQRFAVAHGGPCPLVVVPTPDLPGDTPSRADTAAAPVPVA